MVSVSFLIDKFCTIIYTYINHILGGLHMEENNQVTQSPENHTVPKKNRRRKKTVADIEQQIKELQQKKLELIEKSKIEIGHLVISTLDEEGISLEEIEENKELVFNHLAKVLKDNSAELSEQLDT